MTLRRSKLTVASIVGIAVGLVIAAGILALHHGFSARDPSAMETLVATTARKLAVPSKAKNLKNPVPYSDTVLEEARAHWADHCSFCHANDGSGEACGS